MARVVLIDLDLLGRRASFVIDGQPRTVTLPDGTERQYVAGAALDDLPGWSVSFVDGAGGTRQPSLTFPCKSLSIWPSIDADEDVYEDHDLSLDAPVQLVMARIYWWPEGEVLRDEHEVYRGIARDPQWALFDNGEDRVTVTLAPPRRTDDVPFPPSGIGDDGRFAGALGVPADDAKTQAVPVIYGTVKGLPLYAVTAIGTNPVRLAVASHRIASATLRIMRENVQITAAAPVAYAIDALGGVYAYVTVTAIQYTAGSGFYAEEVRGWTNPDGSLISGLGDILIHSAKTYGGQNWFELDRPRVEAARPALNRLIVGAFSNDRSDGTLLRFIQNRLAGQFPFVVDSASGRLGWDSLLFPADADHQPLASITYGLDAHERTTLSETSADEVLSKIEFTYGYDGYANGSTTSIRLDETNDGGCRRAHTRWGPSPIEALSAPDAADSASAYALLTDIVKKRTWVRTRIGYRGLSDKFFGLPRLAVVHVTDAYLKWKNRPFFLISVQPRLDSLADVELISVTGL